MIINDAKYPGDTLEIEAEITHGDLIEVTLRDENVSYMLMTADDAIRAGEHLVRLGNEIKECNDSLDG